MSVNHHKIFVSRMGTMAKALLAISQPGLVAGGISRGIFLRLDSGWILFLSYERYHSPLTLNLSGGKQILNGIEANQAVISQAGVIQFPSTGIEVDFSHAEIWGAPPLPGNLLPAGERAAALKSVGELILSQDKEPGLLMALKDILGLAPGPLPPLPSQFERMDWSRFLQLFRTKDVDEISSALMPFLGLGSGLTPAGDDLILGLLLAFRRWRTVLQPAFDLDELGARLTREATQKTTLISANLIACADQGQADERLIRSLNGLLSGSPAPEECARMLSDWGNSSGCDAMVGMALAVLSEQTDRW